MTVKIFSIEVHDRIDYDNPRDNEPTGFNVITIDSNYSYSRNNYESVAEPLEFGATYLVSPDESPILEYGDDAFHAWQEDVMNFFEHADEDVASSPFIAALCDPVTDPILFSADSAADIAQVMEDFHDEFENWMRDPGYTTAAEGEEFVGIWEDVENCMLAAAETGSMVIKEF